MSPTSYQTAPPRNYWEFDVTVVLRFGMPSQNNQLLQKELVAETGFEPVTFGL